jgi:hypothetical protein
VFVIRSGLVFAGRLVPPGEVDQELLSMEAEFASVPQHFGCIMLHVVAMGLYFWGNVPLAVFAALLVDSYTFCAVCEADVIGCFPNVGLRVAFDVPHAATTWMRDMAHLATTLVELVASRITSGYHPSPRIVNVAAAVTLRLTWWGITWYAVEAVPLWMLAWGCMSWMCCALLSNGHFGLLFVAFASAAVMVLVALLSVFDVEFITGSSWTAAYVAGSLMWSIFVVYRSNAALFYRPIRTAHGDSKAVPLGGTKPMPKRASRRRKV